MWRVALQNIILLIMRIRFCYNVHIKIHTKKKIHVICQLSLRVCLILIY